MNDRFDPDWLSADNGFGTNQQMFKSVTRLRYLTELSVDLSDLYYAFVHPEERIPAIQMQLPVERLHMRLRYMTTPMNRLPRSRLLLHAVGRSLKHLSLNVLSYGQQTACAFRSLCATT